MWINLQKTNILIICATAKYTFIFRGEAIAIVKYKVFGSYCYGCAVLEVTVRVYNETRSFCDVYDR